jgi:hypothetical protein
VRLRYAGPLPVTFVALGLEVQPGDEFEVDDVEAQRLLRRPDVEEVQAPLPRRKAAKQAAAPADSPAGEVPAPVTEEVDRGVSDDH